MVYVCTAGFYLDKRGDGEGGEVRGSLSSELIRDYMFSYFSLKQKMVKMFGFVSLSAYSHREGEC